MLDITNIAKKEKHYLIITKLLATNTKQLANYTITFVSFARQFILALESLQSYYKLVVSYLYFIGNLVLIVKQN